MGPLTSVLSPFRGEEVKAREFLTDFQVGRTPMPRRVIMHDC